MMNYKKVAGAGVAGVILSLMVPSAMAAFTGTAATYATQAITAPGTVTIPTGTIVYATEAASTSTGALTVVFTLPAGVTYTIAPIITVGGNTGTATLQSGGVGSNSATYLVTLTALGGAAPTTLTLSSFGITGATALSSPTAVGAFPIAEQITASTVAGNPVQAAAVTGTLALSINAASLATAANGNTLTIDITGNNGTKFINTNGLGTVTYGDDGSATFSVATALNADGATQFAFTSPTFTETLTGNTVGITAAALVPTANLPCAATATGNTGATQGVIAASGNSIVFSALPVAAGAREICLYGGGGLLGANPNGFTDTVAIDTSTATAPTLGYNYNGMVAAYAYATNATAYYQQFIRITNTALTPIPVTAQVTTDAGVTSVATVETALAAGASDLVPISTIATNAGSTSANGRFSITMFGPTGTLFENLLVNPGGVVTQLQ